MEKHITNAHLHNGDCHDVLKTLEPDSVDCVVTDPPYGLSFMGKKWDYDVPSQEIFEQCLRVLKPGGYLLSFAGTRTQHRMAVRIEDAGFEIRDMIGWIYGSGFPKSLNVGKAIDKMDAGEIRRGRDLQFTEWMRGTGLTSSQIDKITNTNMGGHYVTSASQPSVPTREYFEMLRPHISCDVPAWVEQMVDERTVESENFKKREVTGKGADYGHEKEKDIEHEFGFKSEYNITAPATPAAIEWDGWGTALKPAFEPITVARKPLSEKTVAANVLRWGTGAMNIDGARIIGDVNTGKPYLYTGDNGNSMGEASERVRTSGGGARSALGRFPANIIHDGSDEVLEMFPESRSSGIFKRGQYHGSKAGAASIPIDGDTGAMYADSGSAARFFKNIPQDDAARFLYCPKASKRERDAGCEGLEEKKPHPSGNEWGTTSMWNGENGDEEWRKKNPNLPRKNSHPTVKPIALMEYLIKLVSREGAVVLDPFMGSGTTGIACKNLGREFIGIEKDAEYFEIAVSRLNQHDN